MKYLRVSDLVIFTSPIPSLTQWIHFWRVVLVVYCTGMTYWFGLVEWERIALLCHTQLSRWVVKTCPFPRMCTSSETVQKQNNHTVFSVSDTVHLSFTAYLCYPSYVNCISLHSNHKTECTIMVQFVHAMYYNKD